MQTGFDSVCNKKIIGCIIGIIVLIASGFIINYHLVDYHSLYEETITVKMSKKNEAYQYNINRDSNVYLDMIEFKILNEGEGGNAKAILNLSDQHGYLLYTGTFDAADKESNIMHPQAKLNANDDYVIEIIASEDQINAEVLISYYDYMGLPGYVRVMIAIAALFALIMIYLVCTNHFMYVKCRSAIVSIFNRNTAPNTWEYILCFLLFMVPFMTLMDGDTRAFVHYEVNFWKSIKEGGGIQYFYEYSNKMIEYYRNNGIGGAFEVIYDFPVYIVLGIWGLPLWIICSAFHLEEVSHFGTMFYGKSIYLFFLPVVAYLIYKICKNIGVNEKNSKWAAFLFLSSLTVFIDIGVMGQLDILGMPFTLLGIYYFQKRCKWKFIMFFAIAVSFKQFPLFAFLPLLLLIEKKVVKIMIDLILTVGFTFLANMPFPKNTAAMQIRGEIRDRFIEIFLGAKLPIYNSVVPVIVILIGSICVYCYLKEIDKQEELEQYSIFIPLLVMFALFASFDSNPYWFIHLAPFLAIMLMYNSKHFNKLILFETVGMLCLILNQFSTNYWCFDSDTGEGMLLDVILGRPDSYLTIEKLLPYMHLDKFAPVCFAGYLLAISTIVYLSRPGHIEQEDLPVRWQALLRLVLNAGVSAIPVFLYVVSIIVF